jgi:hypothetical protein
MKKKSSSNKKPKPIYDGITFDSSLEVYCYKALKNAGIPFKYIPLTFVLQHPFDYECDVYEPDLKRGKLLAKRTGKYQSIKYTPDFVSINKDQSIKNGWIIETKGKANERFKIVWKLFKHYLTYNNIKFDLYLPKNQKQVDQCIELIKSKNE